MVNVEPLLVTLDTKQYVVVFGSAQIGESHHLHRTVNRHETNEQSLVVLIIEAFEQVCPKNPIAYGKQVAEALTHGLELAEIEVEHDVSDETVDENLVAFTQTVQLPEVAEYQTARQQSFHIAYGNAFGLGHLTGGVKVCHHTQFATTVSQHDAGYLGEDADVCQEDGIAHKENT
jgi:hypothetical protein